MPFLDTGELFEIGGISIRIGFNTFTLLMVILSGLAVWGLVAAVREKNLLAILFSFGAVAVFGLFTVATIFTYGYPEL